MYPALHRLEKKQWIESRWGLSESNRKAKYYELTPLGRRQLEVEQNEWNRFVKAMKSVLAQAESI